MNVHENFDRAFEADGSSDRSFGIVMAVFFALVAVLPALRGSLSSIRWWAIAVAAAFLITALIWSQVLHPLNRLWHRLGLLLAKIVSPIVLALVFFAVVAPLGRLMSALGKDPMRLRRTGATSYWIVREPPGPSPQSMKNQF
jgi:glucan phosphoethanolaminetransferase (alkaline phosphatase superfamily)